MGDPPCGAGRSTPMKRDNNSHEIDLAGRTQGPRALHGGTGRAWRGRAGRRPRSTSPDHPGPRTPALARLPAQRWGTRRLRRADAHCATPGPRLTPTTVARATQRPVAEPPEDRPTAHLESPGGLAGRCAPAPLGRLGPGRPASLAAAALCVPRVRWWVQDRAYVSRRAAGWTTGACVAVVLSVLVGRPGRLAPDPARPRRLVGAGVRRSPCRGAHPRRERSPRRPTPTSRRPPRRARDRWASSPRWRRRGSACSGAGASS